MKKPLPGVILVACILLGTCLSLETAPALADDGEEISKLYNQVVELEDAGKGRETLPLAQRMLALAERSFSDKPELLGICLDVMAYAHVDRHEFAKAEAFFKRGLAVREKAFGPDDPRVAESLENLGQLAEDRGRLAEAEALAKRALSIHAKKPGRESDEYADSLSVLASIYEEQGRFAEAEPLYHQTISIREKLFGAESVEVGKQMHNLSILYSSMGRNQEAEKAERRSLAIMEKKLGADHLALATGLDHLGNLAQHRGELAEAERLLRRGMKLREKFNGSDSNDYAASLNNLANLFLTACRYPEAKDFYERALAIQEKLQGPNHPDVAMDLNNLGSLYVALARPEAEQLYRRALAIYEAIYGPEHSDTARTLHNLAVCAEDQGKLADAEALYKRSLSVREKMLGPEHQEVALNLANLARVYERQGRKDEVEPLLLRALEIRRKALGDKSLDVVRSWETLSDYYLEAGREAEAEELARKVLTRLQEVLGENNPRTAQAVASLAGIYVKQKRFADAEPLFKKSLDIRQRAFGAEHPDVAYALYRQADAYFQQERYADAEPLLDRAIQILERVQMAPGTQYALYDQRAQVAWKDKRRSEAVADLHRAMDLAEQIRGETSGAAHERATGFAQFSRSFERMLEWQVELGDTTEALAAIERGRARGLLDDMKATGVDLQAGRPPAERARLEEEELRLKSRVAQLEVEVNSAPQEKRAELEQLTADARAELYKFYRDQRSSSPVYRNLLSVGATPLRLRQLQRSLADSAGLMLIYFIGEEGGFVLVVHGDDAKLHELQLTAEQARQLGVDAGPLHQKRVDRAISGDDNRPGVLPRLAGSQKAPPPWAALHALWQALVPEAEREQLVAGKFQRLIVIPDGQLALLPFETLVVEQTTQPEFLLDVGPPTLYAPSATVLFNLATAQKDPSRKAKEPLLTVADPAYASRGTPKQLASAEPIPAAVATLSAGTSYARGGGELTRLPYSGQEARWLVQGFQEHGQTSLMLAGPQATEAAVRQQLAGHAIIHLACHGLTDQRYGNFFGALAFAPGKPNDPADDGFLMLPEIYELDLKDCELAILSACQTNYGPQQQGEGVWTLSRGFLVAGARRVVASNWLVDDEAAASLISYYAIGLAAQRQKGQTPDYAAALHAAKCWVRQQGKWSSPYYWGTFELIGPQ